VTELCITRQVSFKEGSQDERDRTYCFSERTVCKRFYKKY